MVILYIVPVDNALGGKNLLLFKNLSSAEICTQYSFFYIRAFSKLLNFDFIAFFEHDEYFEFETIRLC